MLTGTRRRRRYLVYVWGTPVWLSGSLLEALCDLVAAAQSGMGDAAAAPFTIHRLRRAIDAALGRPGAGLTLIETAGDRYRLNLAPSQVALEAGFAHLAECGLLAHEQVAALARRCAAV